MSAFLRLEGLVKRFDGVVAVDGLSLALERGEMLALLGPSGSGKTTTLRLLAGFESPDAGRVIVDGEDVTRVEPVARRFGMVFQHYALFPHLDVGRERRVRPGILGARGEELRRRVARALELVDLAGFERRRVGQLSGGQQQRVALARALAPEPRVLLLDEPLSNLDPTLRERTRREIRELIQRVGITTVLVTHEQDEAFDLGDRVAVLRGGRLEQVGSADELYGAPANLFVGGFVGRSSSFEVDVLSVTARGVRVAVDGVDWTVDAPRVARCRDRVRPSCWCGPSLCGSSAGARRGAGDGHRAAVRRPGRAVHASGPTAAKTVEIAGAARPPRDRASGSACCRAGGRAAESTSSRAISRDRRARIPARRLRAPRGAGLARGLSDRARAARGRARAGRLDASIRGIFPERPTEWRALWGSLWISLASVVLAAAIGLPLAVLFARYEFPGVRLLGAVVALPAVLPPLVGVLAFLFLYGETGFVSLLVQRVLGWRSRRGDSRAPARYCWFTPTRCTSTSTCSPGPRSPRSTPRCSRPPRVSAPGGGDRSGASSFRSSIPRSAARRC